MFSVLSGTSPSDGAAATAAEESTLRPRGTDCEGSAETYRISTYVIP